MRSLSEKRSETRKISHNPEVLGSNPSPATKKPEYFVLWFFVTPMYSGRVFTESEVL